MSQKIVESKATVVDLNGEKWAIVLLIIDPEVRSLISDRVWELLGKYDHLLTAIQHEDGTLGFGTGSPELEARILEKIPPVHSWTTVRLYP